MKVKFLNESVEVVPLEQLSINKFPISSWAKKHIEGMSQSPLTPKDMDSYSKKLLNRMGKKHRTVLKHPVSINLTDGKPAFVAIFPFGIVYCYAELGQNISTGTVVARNCFRFEPHDEFGQFSKYAYVGMNFLMNPIHDLNSQESKSSSNKARTLIKKFSKCKEYRDFKELFGKESKGQGYRYSW